MGRYIATCIDKGVACEESLSMERAEALKLFKRHQPRMDITNVDLRPWQKDKRPYVYIKREIRY